MQRYAAQWGRFANGPTNSETGFRLPENKIEYKLRRKSETNEWVVAAYVNGKFNDEKSYYTDDKQDAIKTMKMMQSDGG
jgi:hypothetical protein